MEEKISSATARNIILNAQLLDGKTTLSKGKEGIARIIGKLGYVQIDTISVINRSHHHTLWVRQGNYHESMLHELQAKDRSIFEYWSHAMSYLPITDYRYYLPRMRNFKNPTSRWAKYQFEKCRHLLQPVLERIRKEGPLSAKDFSSPPGKKSTGWWDWKPAKVALELLFWKGDLMISSRNKFQKIYDLTERVLPDHVDRTMPNQDELGQFLVRRALSALGIASKKDIQKFLQPESARDSDLQTAGQVVLQKSLKSLIEMNEVTPVTLERNNDSEHFILSKTLEKTDFYEASPYRIHLFSPFDNMIINRDRIKRFFGFDYALECFLPVKKRKYGYFNLPILWNGSFVGRLDPKTDRKNRILIVKNLVFEPQFNSSDAFIHTFAKKLVELALFNNCSKIVIESVTPDKLKSVVLPVVTKYFNS